MFYISGSESPHIRKPKKLATAKLAVSAIALTVACGFSAPAFAQDAAPVAAADSDVTEVVVTGIRRGIQNAIATKKGNANIVEVVSAEDIGKLPDQSIAESIARLPGIAAQRTNGRAQTLSIRGLGPDYTVTTLNGREQVSTNDNRSVEFDQFPSELINQVLIYKTPNAAMTTQGIAGTADLQTVRPLAYGKRAIALNVRKEFNSEDAAVAGLSNEGERYSINYIDQFFNKTLGVALGYARTTSPYQVTRLEPWGDGDLPALPTGEFIPGGQKSAVQSSNLERDGYMAVVEWRPNDRLRMTFDAYYSEFEELQRIARLEYPLYWSSSALQPGYTTEDGYVTSGTFTGVKTVVENYTNQRQSTVQAFGVNTVYNLNDQWTLIADISTQKVERDDIIIESTAGTGPSGSGATDTIDFRNTGENNAYVLSGVLDYSDFNTVFLTDPGGWGGVTNRAGFFRAPHVEDEMDIIKLAVERTVGAGPINKVTFGASRNDHTKSKYDYAAYMSLGSVAQLVVPEKYRLGTTDASFLGNTSGMISYDSLGMYRDGLFTLVQSTDSTELKRDWSVSETIDVIFLKGDIDTTFFGIPVSGNVGIQVQKAEQEATSLFLSDTERRIVTDGDDYMETLPSLNLNFQVAEDMTVRVGAGTTLARPRMDDMSAGTTYDAKMNTEAPVLFSGNAYGWSGNGGNAQIRPWKANAFDLSVEKYFGRKGYVSAALFYKDLTSFIYNRTVLKDYTGAPLPSKCYESGTNNTVQRIDPITNIWVCSLADANRIGITSAQANGEGGWIKGAEFTVSVPGEMIHPILDGFGAILTASFNDSEINPSGSAVIPVPGLSEKIINSTVYYEKHGFSARVSSRYRGDFTGEVPDFTNALQNRTVREETVVDAQMSYTFQDGPLKDLAISVSGSNLTNEPFYLYKGNNVVKEEKYGSTYLVGLSYKF
jgi:iron complex outermembrane receptor protein